MLLVPFTCRRSFRRLTTLADELRKASTRPQSLERFHPICESHWRSCQLGCCLGHQRLVTVKAAKGYQASGIRHWYCSDREDRSTPAAEDTERRDHDTNWAAPDQRPDLWRDQRPNSRVHRVGSDHVRVLGALVKPSCFPRSAWRFPRSPCPLQAWSCRSPPHRRRGPS